RRPVTGVTGSRGVRASSGLGVGGGFGFGHGNSPRFLGGVTVRLTGYRLFGYRVTVTGHVRPPSRGAAAAAAGAPSACRPPGGGGTRCRSCPARSSRGRVPAAPRPARAGGV